MKKLTGKFNDELEIKRFYFDGKIKIECPKCKSGLEQDFNNDYISYPHVGKEDTLNFYCPNCEKEWEMPYKLKAINVILEYDDTKITEYK